MNSEINAVNHPSGGVNRPPTKARGVKTRRSKKSRQEVGENAGAALQNVPEARMQDLADGEPQSSLGGVGTGGYGYSPYRPLGGMVPNGPSGHRNYQQPPPPNQTFRIFEDGNEMGTGPTHQFEPSLFYSPFSEDNLHSSTQPQLGTGYHNQNSYPSVPPNGVGAALQQQTPFDGHSSVGRDERAGTMYSMPAQTSNPRGSVIHREIRFRRILRINGFGMAMLIIAICYRYMTLRQVVTG